MITITDEIAEAFSGWQRRLASSKSSKDTGVIRERQIALRDAVRRGVAAFLDYLEEELRTPMPLESDLPPMVVQVTPAEAFNPPIELEARLAEAWAEHVSPRNAAQSVYWTLCYGGWFKQGALGNDPGAVLVTGKPGPQSKTPDQFARTLMRNIGGLHHVRGPVSVFSDCPFARAYWRYRIADEATNASGGRLSHTDAHQALHRNQIWETLISLCVRRVTVLNNHAVRAAVVALIASRPTLKPQELVEIAWIIGAHGQAFIFDQMPDSEVQAVVDRAVAQVLGD